MNFEIGHTPPTVIQMRLVKYNFTNFKWTSNTKEKESKSINFILYTYVIV